jgi:hypothetical protein
MVSRKFIAVTGFLALALCLGAAAQDGTKPLTDADVVKMVKGRLPESVIISAIQAGPTKFDTSPDALIKLHTAGVTEKEMDAIMAASSVASGAQAAPPAAASSASQAQTAPASAEPPAATTPAAATTQAESVAPMASAAPSGQEAATPRWQMPTVAVVQSGANQQLPLEKTQLAQTKTKPESMSSLAGDSVMTQSIQAGVNTAATDAAIHTSSAAGAMTMQQAGGIFSGVMGRRKPTVTYVWAILNPASANVLQTTTPTFSVNFSNPPGVNPDQFAPAIVKLTPAQNTCRIVGASRGKEDAGASAAADWEVYSSFLEERVEANARKTAKGEYEISPKAPLLPGEYAVVLRPVSKSLKFSGGDVMRGQGNGLIFDSAWSFSVSADAH